MSAVQRLQPVDGASSVHGHCYSADIDLGWSDGYPDGASAFAAKLELWLGQVARELAPKYPALALDRFEAFMEADPSFFESTAC